MPYQKTCILINKIIISVTCGTYNYFCRHAHSKSQGNMVTVPEIEQGNLEQPF